MNAEDPSSIDIDLSGFSTSTCDPIDRRLGEAMLHIATRSEDDPKFGAVKLNKILFFADAISFVRNGKAIVGCEFMRLDQGPVPRRFLPVKDSLEQSKRAVLQNKVLVSGRTQKRLIALDPPDLREFSGEEIALLDTVIAALRDRDAQEVSDMSHALPAWELAENKETIPLEAAFIQTLNPDSSDIARVDELSKLHSW